MKRLSGLIVVAAFVAVGCNRAEEPATSAAPEPQAYGNLARLMQAIPFPASNIIFDAQTTDPGAPVKPGDTAGSATAQYGGIPEYAGWNAVENAAIALQETANLIMIPGRLCQNGQPVPIDQDDFMKAAANLAAVGAEVQKFAQARTWSENSDALIDITGKVSDACLLCHEKYRDTPDAPKDRCMVTAPAAAN